MSSANARLKAVRRLARRPPRELCIAEGSRSVRAALAAGATVQELYLAPELLVGGRDGDLAAAADRSGADVVEVGIQAFASLTERRPDGVLAVVQRPATTLDTLAEPPEPFVAVTVSVERPGNLGAIARTACAAGADALLIADPRTDAFHRDAIRGSVGAVFRLPCVSASSREVLAWLRERPVRIFATAPGAATPYWEVSYAGGVAVAFGSERHGLSKIWLEASDEHVVVPAHGPVDSLNVAVAAGVVLCEAARTRLRSPVPARQREHVDPLRH